MKTTKEQRDKWQQLSDAASPLWEGSEHGGYPIIIQQRIFSPDPVPLICEMANTDFAREARTAVPALLRDFAEMEAAIREQGTCRDCKGKKTMYYECSGCADRPGYHAGECDYGSRACYMCDGTGLQPWAAKALGAEPVKKK